MGPEVEALEEDMVADDPRGFRMSLKGLLREVRGCAICQVGLPLGARPVLQLASSAKLLIISQAPGRKVHETGIPWNDASGDRLRDWLALDQPAFYDETRVAILPMGFCYPGAEDRGGDKPPRAECAPLWHARLRKHLPNIQLTLLVGQYAQRYYLRRQRKASMTETIRAFSEYGPQFFPLPHPSWRSVVWMRKNQWFEETLIPNLREVVRPLLQRSEDQG
jgi:uracil-DNA glycosylase